MNQGGHAPHRLPGDDCDIGRGSVVTGYSVVGVPASAQAFDLTRDKVRTPFFSDNLRSLQSW